jgi:hypothetical protein
MEKTKLSLTKTEENHDENLIWRKTSENPQIHHKSDLI